MLLFFDKHTFNRKKAKLSLGPIDLFIGNSSGLLVKWRIYTLIAQTIMAIFNDGTNGRCLVDIQTVVHSLKTATFSFAFNIPFCG